jgi:hypothetical protein
MSNPSSPLSTEEPARSRSSQETAGSVAPDAVALEAGPGARSTPQAYDDYYLLVVKNCLRYACPIAAAIYLACFGLDVVSTAAAAVLIKTALFRLAFASILVAFWFIAPRMQSVRAMMTILTVMYLAALLDFIAIMRLLPDGFVEGTPGLVIVAMCASGLFCLRPTEGAVAGSIGLAAFVAASFSAQLPSVQLTIAASQLAAAELLGYVFLVLMDREFRKRHALERSLESEKAQSEILLKEILPRYVIQRIREGAQSIADSLLEVNVIFIDIVEFTEMSRRLAPKHLVEVLGKSFNPSMTFARRTALPRSR